MKEYKIHLLWSKNRQSANSRALNEYGLNRLAREGWEIVGFFDADNLCILLQREKEINNGLEK